MKLEIGYGEFILFCFIYGFFGGMVADIYRWIKKKFGGQNETHHD